MAIPPEKPTTAREECRACIASSQPKSQSAVLAMDSGRGRPIPRFANQAYPPPSGTGARTEATVVPAGRCGASPAKDCSSASRP